MTSLYTFFMHRSSEAAPKHEQQTQDLEKVYKKLDYFLDEKNAYSNEDNAKHFLELLTKMSRDNSDEADELTSSYLGFLNREKTHDLLLQSTTFVEEHREELMQLLGVKKFINALYLRNKDLFRKFLASMIEKDGLAIDSSYVEGYLEEFDDLPKQTKKMLLGKHAETIARYYMGEKESDLVLLARREMDARIERDYVMDVDAQLNSGSESYIDNPPSYGTLFKNISDPSNHALLEASKLRREHMRWANSHLTDEDIESRKNPTQVGELLFKKKIGSEPKDLIWLTHIGGYEVLVFKDPDDFEAYAQNLPLRRSDEDVERDYEYTNGLHNSGGHILVKMCNQAGELGSEEVLAVLRHEWQHLEHNTVRKTTTWAPVHGYNTSSKVPEFKKSWSGDKRVGCIKNEFLAFYCGSSTERIVSALEFGYGESFSDEELAKLRNELVNVKQTIVDNSGEELDYFERRLLAAHLVTVQWEDIPEAIDLWFDFYKKRRADIRDIFNVRKHAKALQEKYKDSLLPSVAIEAIQGRSGAIMDELEQLENPFLAKHALYKTTSEEVFNTQKDVDSLYEELESLYGDPQSHIFGADKMGLEKRQAIGDRYLEILSLAMEDIRADTFLIKEERVDGVFEVSPEVVDMFRLALNAKKIRCTYGVRGKKINFTLRVSSDDGSYRIRTALE